MAAEMNGCSKQCAGESESTNLCPRSSGASSVYVSLGLCQLNQWAMDFKGNCDRIIESIVQVKKMGGFYRMGPELEVCGYSCDDHFFESDTVYFCWQTICRILESDLTHNCLVDIGMPIMHKSVRYNCRIYMLNKKIILLRPKMFLANDGSYREIRWFAPWKLNVGLQEFILPKSVQRTTGQETCPIGFAGVQCNDCLIAAETCEELFAPESPHLCMCLGGVEVFTNGSASYFQTGKLGKRFDLTLAPTAKAGGIYMYCNMKGNDGGKLAFDGSSFIACNGEIVNMIEPFRVNDVEVMVETINIQRVRSYRAANPSYGWQAAGAPMPTVRANIWLSGVDDSSIRVLHFKRDQATSRLVLPEVPAELAAGCANWLWDYLRRCGGQGFFIPLSGGADSACCACIVRMMCRQVITSVWENIPGVREDLERVLGMKSEDAAFPKTERELVYQILHTAYLSTKSSSKETLDRARGLANELGAYFLEIPIDDVIRAETDLIGKKLNFAPRFCSRAAEDPTITKQEDLALQNLQARLRMQISYYLASMLPIVRSADRLAPPPENPIEGEPKTGDQWPLNKDKIKFLLVLGTGNLDETYRGYFTKYDCSSGDLAPIGSISKVNIQRVLRLAAELFEAPHAEEIAKATPTAELRPVETTTDRVYKQCDEEEMGISYEELYLFGTLMKNERCGPLEMYERLIRVWRSRGRVSRSVVGGQSPVKPTPSEPQTIEEVNDVALDKFINQNGLDEAIIAEKVKHFFRCYASMRHKGASLPPSYHAEAHDADASRFDWRPTLYPSFDYVFAQMDHLVEAARQTDPQIEVTGGSNAHQIIYSNAGSK